MMNKKIFFIMVWMHFTSASMSFAGDTSSQQQSSFTLCQNLIPQIVDMNIRLERMTIEHTLVSINTAYQLLSEYESDLKNGQVSIKVQASILEILKKISHLNKCIVGLADYAIKQGRAREIADFINSLCGKYQAGSNSIVQSHVFYLLRVENGTIYHCPYLNLENFTRPIHIAAQHGYDDIVRCLLIEDINAISKRNERGYTPLHCAVIGQQLEAVQILLEAGADQNIRDPQGYTPAELALELKVSNEILIHLLL